MSLYIIDQFLKKLPKTKGKYKFNVSLAKLTCFKVGGCADILFIPQNEDDLIFFLKNKPQNIPIMIIGLGSNILVRDGGINGIVIKLNKNFNKIKVIDYCTIIAGAGAIDARVAKVAYNYLIDGFAFLKYIPGSIGGALKMNAGACGFEIKDILIEARAVDMNGNLHILNSKDMRFKYRCCNVSDNLIFLSAIFRGTVSSKENIRIQMDRIKKIRKITQPINVFTGGSTFKNLKEISAWKLIDKAGFRGFIYGDVQVSEKHTNFLINLGNATATDIEKLGNMIKTSVKCKFGLDLCWEIKCIGHR